VIMEATAFLLFIALLLTFTLYHQTQQKLDAASALVADQTEIILEDQRVIEIALPEISQAFNAAMNHPDYELRSDCAVPLASAFNRLCALQPHQQPIPSNEQRGPKEKA
jgi:hypothetical protein